MKEKEKQSEKPLETVSRAEYDRLRLDMTAERLLAAAGARNLTAARALLDLAAIDLHDENWQELLAQQVQELRRGAETAFLFARDCDSGDWHWLGLVPAAAGDAADIYAAGEGGGFAFRLAQAEDGLEAIKIKQEAAAQGIIL